MPKSITVIIPVYNEDEKVLLRTVRLLKCLGFDTLVIDDGSSIPVDKDIEMFAKVIRRKKNKGYGNAIKAGIRSAKSEYIGLIDADYQYDPLDLKKMWDSITNNDDMVIGARVCPQGGIRRNIGRITLSMAASLLCLRLIPDLNSGVRIFKRRLAKDYASILCDTFSYSSSLTMSFILDGFKTRWMPVGFYPRQGSKSTVKMVHHGLITLYHLLYITIGLRTRGLRGWLRQR